jgi:hypothetical protein
VAREPKRFVQICKYPENYVVKLNSILHTIVKNPYGLQGQFKIMASPYPSEGTAGINKKSEKL